jgi:hypothetical protein
MSKNNDYMQVKELDAEFKGESSELQFQNFNHDSNDISGSLSANTRNLPRVNPNQTFVEATDKNLSRFSFFKLSNYSKYFDVDTQDVTTRMLKSINPRGNFVETIQLKPDLYGPFWIPTTLIFLLFIVQSVRSDTTAYKELSVAAFSVYFYVYCSPVLLWGVSKYFELQPNLLEFLTFYGYSLTVWIPAILLCVVHIEAVDWLVLFIACGSSGYFMFKCLDNTLYASNNKMNRISALGIMAASNIIFTLVLKFTILTNVLN